MDWSKLDPNAVMFLLSLVGTAALWLYRKARGEQQASLRGLLWPSVEAKAIELAESDAFVEGMRDELRECALDALRRIGVKPSALVEVIVTELVERGVAELRKRILARKVKSEVQTLLDRLADPAFLRAFTPPPPSERTVPPLDASMFEVTRIEDGAT